MDDTPLMGDERIEPAHRFSYSASAVACNAGTDNAGHLKVSEVFVDLFCSFALCISPPLNTLEILVPVDHQATLFTEPRCIDDEMAAGIWCRPGLRRTIKKPSDNAENCFGRCPSGRFQLPSRSPAKPCIKNRRAIEPTDISSFPRECLPAL